MTSLLGNLQLGFTSHEGTYNFPSNLPCHPKHIALLSSAPSFLISPSLITSSTTTMYRPPRRIYSFQELFEAQLVGGANVTEAWQKATVLFRMQMKDSGATAPLINPSVEIPEAQRLGHIYPTLPDTVTGVWPQLMFSSVPLLTRDHRSTIPPPHLSTQLVSTISSPRRSPMTPWPRK